VAILHHYMLQFWSIIVTWVQNKLLVIEWQLNVKMDPIFASRYVQFSDWLFNLNSHDLSRSKHVMV
jgi:hypothetical protein